MKLYNSLVLYEQYLNPIRYFTHYKVIQPWFMLFIHVTIYIIAQLCQYIILFLTLLSFYNINCKKSLIDDNSVQ